MAQKVKALHGKPKDPSSIPRTHMVKGEEYTCRLSFDLTHVSLPINK